jgi:N-acetyl-anhydromuramyl-L-alanine amidase AmpD
MNRIIMHWTAGTRRANATDKRHYHFMIQEQNGKVSLVHGNHPVDANRNLTGKSSKEYAAHTRALNTGSIGIAVCGMRGAKERPFFAGDAPMTRKQIDLLVSTVADLASKYNIPVTRETVLTHAEVEPTLRVKQRAKWDITWLPGMAFADVPVVVGDILRTRIRAAQREAMVGKPVAPKPSKPSPHRGGLLAWLIGLFRGFK